MSSSVQAAVATILCFLRFHNLDTKNGTSSFCDSTASIQRKAQLLSATSQSQHKERHNCLVRFSQPQYKERHNCFLRYHSLNTKKGTTTL